MQCQRICPDFMKQHCGLEIIPFILMRSNVVSEKDRASCLLEEKPGNRWNLFSPVLHSRNSIFQGSGHLWLCLWFLAVFYDCLCSFFCLLHTESLCNKPSEALCAMLVMFFNEITQIRVLDEGSSLWFSLRHVVSGPCVLAGAHLNEVQEHFPVSDSLSLPVIIIILLLFSSCPFAAILRIKAPVSIWKMCYSEILAVWTDAFCSVVSIGIG